jgi:tetratricopeptide (TPR) repeat protein
LEAASDLAKQHKFDLALPILNRLIKEHPNCLKARLIRGRALRELGKYEAALTDFDHVIQQTPHHMAAHRDKGLIEYDQRNYLAAIASLSIAIGHLPSAQLFKVRANAYKGLGQNEAAIADYLSAKKIYARQGVKHQVRQIEKQIHTLYCMTQSIGQSHRLQVAVNFPFEQGRHKDKQHLLKLLDGDRAKACRLLESSRSRNPSRSVHWYFEKTIHDLERDRK